MKCQSDKGTPRSGIWRQQGFSDFIRGTFGNAGHNLYVSKAGVLQRIHCYDLNRDGYLDIVCCNSQNHWEKPPAYVYRDPLGSADLYELPSDGAWSGAVADLNGDGYDDLILGMRYNGISFDLNAFIYYGGRDGLSEECQQQLPAPMCTSAAVGDFNGDGQPDLALLCNGKVRLFYQSELGFEPKRYVDLEIDGEQLAAGDLDGDGFADLIVRCKDGLISVYWGGASGISVTAYSTIPVETDELASVKPPLEQYAEYVPEAVPLVKIINLNNIQYVFVARAESVYLVPVENRCFGVPIVLACPLALSIAVGDVNGDGRQDIVLACRQADGRGECSWIYWGSEVGFHEEHRTRLETFRACDVAVDDLDGDGCDDIVFCQSHNSTSFTTHSLVYRGAKEGVFADPVRLVSHDARRVLLARLSEDKHPQVVFVNYFARDILGRVPTSVYFGAADGFSPERRCDLPSQGAVEAVCCDIDDDGSIDVVIANCSENSVSRDPGSFIYLNGPDGFGGSPDLKLPTTRAHGVACADLNRDGYLDLVFCGFNNPELLVFYGSDQGFNTSRPERIRMEHKGVLYNDPRWIYLADLNNDGWLDLIVPQVSHDRSFILWGGPEGFSMDRCKMLSVFRGASARAADLTGNGYLDLIIGGHAPSNTGPHDSFVYIYWNGPEGLSETRRMLLPANTVNAMSVADFDNDGTLDLFICSYHDGKTRDIDSYIYWNRNGRGFSATDRTRLYMHSASGCMAADFNADGWIDLAVAYHKVYGDHVGYSAVWWNGPDGFSEESVTTLPTTGPHGMVSGGPGNIMDRGPEEYYVSEPFELPEGSRVTSVSWEAQVPPKTWVRAQLRFSDTRKGLEEAEWIGPDSGRSWFENGDEFSQAPPCGGWIQYRLALGATNSSSTPRVTEVALSYYELD